MRALHLALVLVLATCVAGGAGAAPGSTAYRCTVELTEADGTTTTVPAWGADTESALGQGRRWARILAADRFSEQVWAWAFWGDGEDTELARGVMARGTADDPLRVPGASVVDGKCKKVRLPGKGADRWEATWSAGEAQPVVREDPSTAIEAARRRACMETNDAARGDVFVGVGHLAGAEKVSAWREGTRAAVADLFACVAGGEPVLRGVDGGDEVPDSHGAYQCHAASFSDAGGAAGVGWSTGLERAGEEALTELIFNRRRAALAFGLTGSARAAAETKQVMLAVGYSASMPSVAGSDLADQGRLSCMGVEAGDVPPLSWVPGPVFASQNCGERPYLPPVSGLTSIAEVAEARDDLCRDRAYYGIDLANQAVAAASPETAGLIARSGWGISLTCEADCVAHTVLATDADVVHLPGLPDRTTRAAAEATLIDAIVLHDLEMLSLVAPIFDDPAFQDSLLVHYPLLFWLSLPPMIQHGIEDGEIGWQSYGGQWLLMVGE